MVSPTVANGANLGTQPVRPRRLVGVSLKMYFSKSDTHSYLTAVVALAPLVYAADLDFFIIPDFLTIPAAQAILRGSGILYGAQDAFWEDAGAYTGEVSPSVLREFGCSLVELGHAERRRFFGETDEIVGKKAAAATRHGITPLICIGERSRPVDNDEERAVDLAVAECRSQIEVPLAALPDKADIVLAYEPVWAIGQSQPASARHVVAVTKRLRALTQSRGGTTRILYGGSAGPGTFAEIAGGVEGLFLGRFAHNLENLKQVISEVGVGR